LVLKRARQAVEARPAPAELAELQLLERLRSLMAADRHDVVKDVVTTTGEPAGSRMPDAPLGFELDAGQQERWIDEGTQPTRRVGRAHERLRTIELGHVGFERLRQHERDAASHRPIVPRVRMRRSSTRVRNRQLTPRRRSAQSAES